LELSDCAKQVGVTDKTAWQWWKAGRLDAYQLPTGTSMVREPQTAASGVALYARVASADQREDALRQLQRLRDYAAARGYRVVAAVTEVTEMAPGLNDARPQRKEVLTHPTVGVIVVAQWGRLARFGYGDIATLLAHEGRRVEAVFPTDTGDTGDGLVEDCVAVITGRAARISGRRNGQRRAARLRTGVEHVMRDASEDESEDA
jgi:predicted site-specific integrase-resolvase